MLFAVDAHVHLEDSLPDFAAVEQRMATASGRRDAVPVLLLTERHGRHVHRELGALFEPTADGLGLVRRGGSLIVVPGRQFESEERIEILAYGYGPDELEGRSAVQIIRELAKDGVPVALPWGVGKWTGPRRAAVRQLIADFGDGLLLGDIAGRPSLWPEPLFAGCRVLNGGDNLPIAGGSLRIGSFGSLVEGFGPNGRPVESLFRSLRDHAVLLRDFGARRSLIRSGEEQLRLRFAREAA